MTYAIVTNEQFNSLEVAFDAKPDEVVRAALKALGFRWNPKKSVWYGFAERKELESALNGGKASKSVKKSLASLPSLWDRCKTDDIPEHDRHASTKDVAAETRKHIKSRFPEIRFSCRIGNGGWSALNEVNFTFTSSPYAKDSVYFKYIKSYIEAWLASFNYDNSDSMTDYFDRNFYENISTYGYTEVEPTGAQVDDMKDFDRQLELFKEQEQERQALEAEKFREEQEAKEKEIKERIARNEAMKADILSHIEIVELLEAEKYIVTADMICGCGKDNDIDEVKEHGHEKTESALIKKEIYFTDSTLFEGFCNLFLYDFDFLEGCGGTGTLDKRCDELENLYSLNQAQRESVKWIVSNGVAVFLNNELKLVIDPQGYNYARYVNVVVSDYSKQLLSDAENEESNTEREPFHFPSSYEDKLDSLSVGSVYTLIYEGPWALSTSMHYITLNKCSIEKYAQYDKSLYIEYTEAGKRKPDSHFFTPTSSMLLYKGALSRVPESLQRRQIARNMFECMTAGANVKEFLINVYKYYEALGYTPVIDTLQF